MKMYEFWLKFHWTLFRGPINNIPALVQIIAWRPQAIIWINDGYWRIYVPVGLNYELTRYHDSDD